MRLGVAFADIRAPVSTFVACSDTTPVRVVAVRARVSQAFADALCSHAEHRGKHARLDWGSSVFQLAEWDAAPLPDDALAL